MRKTTSTNFQNESQATAGCPIFRATRLIAPRWRTHILWFLQYGPCRFSEICAAIPLATERMIALRLRDLQADRLLESTSEDGLPLYRLTPNGESLIPILFQLITVGQRQLSPPLSDTYRPPAPRAPAPAAIPKAYGNQTSSRSQPPERAALHRSHVQRRQEP